MAMRERRRKPSLLVCLIIDRNADINDMGAIKQEWVRVTHTPFHHHQSYTLNDVFVIKVALSCRKGQEMQK